MNSAKKGKFTEKNTEPVRFSQRLVNAKRGLKMKEFQLPNPTTGDLVNPLLEQYTSNKPVHKIEMFGALPYQ